MLLDELLRLEGKRLPCFVPAYSVYIFLSITSNMLGLRTAKVIVMTDAKLRQKYGYIMDWR
eukprot:6293-Heterococcus_DN1.PRE.1